MVPGFTWPLARNVIRKRVLSNTFGMVRHYPNGAPKPHHGWDLEATVCTPAYAVATGKVEFVTSGGDYGRQVCLSFQVQGHVRYAFYAHLQHVYVTPGKHVTLDDLLATTGKSGNAANLPADEDHLHFEIRTQAVCGLGLAGRVTPLTLYGVCPLHTPILG